MYTVDKVYRSIIYHVAQLAPSGVAVVEGESYGVNFDDPTGQSPSIAVTVEDIGDVPVELGSYASSYDFTVTINAKSRLQRDALKSIVYSGLLQNTVYIYPSFPGNTFVPASGAAPERVGEVYSAVMRDMPNFESDRERFFWVTVVVSSLTVLGF